MLIKAGSQFIASGYVPSDAEIKYVGANNTKCIKFGFKAAEKRGADGNAEAVWVNVSAFGKTADAAENVRKGDIVLVTGTVSQSQGYDGKFYLNYTADFVDIQNKQITPQAVQSAVMASPTEIDITDFEVLADDDVPF